MWLKKIKGLKRRHREKRKTVRYLVGRIRKFIRQVNRKNRSNGVWKSIIFFLKCPDFSQP
jgi:hypothetical protein